MSEWTANQDLWPEYLRDGAPSRTCSTCGRRTWDTTAFGYRCWMPQPDGTRCEGTFGKDRTSEGLDARASKEDQK